MAVLWKRIALLAGAFLVALAGEPLNATEGRPGWKAEWEKTIELAKKEGQVVLLAGPDRFATFRDFQKKYPEIKLVAVPGGTEVISQRVMAERRAGKYLADLYLSGSGLAYNFYEWKVLDPISSTFILPEVLDESKWWGGKHVYQDDERRYVFVVNGYVQHSLSYNTKLVNPKEIGSYWNLLNPKWKGKLVSLDPTMGSAVSDILSFFYHNPKLGPEFVRRFFSQPDLAVSRDRRQLVDWLATSKYLIGVTQPTGVMDAKVKGLPVDNFDTSGFKEPAPLSASSGNLALFNRAPHPNAAKVLNQLVSFARGPDPVSDP